MLERRNCGDKLWLRATDADKGGKPCAGERLASGEVAEKAPTEFERTILIGKESLFCKRFSGGTRGDSDKRGSTVNDGTARRGGYGDSCDTELSWALLSEVSLVSLVSLLVELR